MAYTQAYICDCGELFRHRYEAVEHIESNQTHIISEALTSKDNLSAPSKVVVQDEQSEIRTLAITEEGIQVADDEGDINKIINVTQISESKSVKSSSWAVATKFIYLGTEQIGEINKSFVRAYMNRNQTHYDIRLVNSENSDVICEKYNLTNTREEIIDLGEISNLPENSTIIEIQLRGDKYNKKVYFKGITIKY